MCAMVFLVNLARVIFAPLLQPAAADFSVSPEALGIVASAAWLGSAAPRLPTGYLLTRFERHHVVAATGTLLVFTALGTAYSRSIAGLTLGAFLMGLSSGIYFIAANPLVSELYPEGVGRAIGVHGMSSQLAAVCAPIAVSAVLLVGAWRYTFLVIAAVAAVATVSLVVAARRADLPDAGSEDRSVLAAGRAQWPVVLTGVAFVGTAGFLWNGLFNLYGSYLVAEKGITEGTGRTLLSLTFAAGVPAFLLSGRLADRIPNVPLLLGIVGAFSLATVLLTTVQSLVAVAVVSVAVGFAVHGLFPAVDTYVLSALPDHHRGSAYALFSASAVAVQAFGSGTVGAAVARGASYTLVFRGLAVAVFCLVAVLGVLYRLGVLPTGGIPGETPDVTASTAEGD